MLVSVIIPSFRQPQFLWRAIESVVEQDYTDIEVIVVDDLSLDSSLAVAVDAMQRDPRVRVLARRTNGGLGRARNTGLVAARGELVTFLDADDYLLKDSIWSRVKVWQELSEADRERVTGVYGDWQHVGEDVNYPQTVRSPRDDLPTIDASTYAGDNIFICSSPILRPEPLLEVGGFAEGVPMLEDYAAWARLLADGASFVPASAVVCTYRQRPSSMLRGKASTLMAMTDEINGWLTDHGVGLMPSGGVFDELDNGTNPRSVRVRRNEWFRAGSFGSNPARSSGNHQLLADASSATASVHSVALPAFMERTRADLDGLLDDVDEVQPRQHGPRRSRPNTQETPMPRVLFAPSTLEESLDAVALVSALESVDCPAAIVATQPRTTGERWPTTLADAPVLSVDALSDDAERMVLFADGGSIRQQAIGRFSRADLAIRTSGLHALDVYARGSARRYRDGDRILTRSRLEAAELGDRPAVLLPSGVSLAASMIWGERTPTDDIVVMVPSTLGAAPWTHAWTHMAVTAAQAAGGRTRLMAAPSIAASITDLRPEPVNVQALRDAACVVTPLDATMSLVESLGGRPVVLDPIQHPDAVSNLWRRAHGGIHDADALRAALEDPPPVDPDLATLVSLHIADDLVSLGEAARTAILEER